METISIITIISIAFLGSFGHCVGMCGGIVIAYSSTKIKSHWTKQVQAFAHLLYSFGRITTYMILGALFGLASTFIFPKIVARFGLIKGSRHLLLFQTITLVLAFILLGL